MPQDLSTVSWPVRTTRLTIRPITVDDLTAVFGIRWRPEVSEWLPALPTDCDEFVERMSDPERLAVTLALGRDGVLAGNLHLNINDPWAKAEVAEQARGTQAELGWVLALCFADNVASWRIMEKLGLRREEHTRAESLHRSGRWLDGLGDALLADEWRDARRRPSI